MTTATVLSLAESCGYDGNTVGLEGLHKKFSDIRSDIVAAYHLGIARRNRVAQYKAHNYLDAQSRALATTFGVRA